nr:immunoglobulin light chain junction region [Macaca mulatta]MOW42819.1 immunoglobulin light chain junction region [Macaca mulatta]MOW44208.1 immunoglobulin light chain junction region [Macaca mulatta]MOW44387.1 immunoglobulin light chain junction region [Macaca mulatta]
CMQALDYPWTF